MTPSELQKRTGCLPYAANTYCDYLNRAMVAYDINTPMRQAQFLAQVAHESALFRYSRELWGPTDAQKRYEGRTDLGNIKPGDGYKFRGAGLIQITGRNNFREVGEALALPLEDSPELLQLPRHATDSAAWFWHKHGLNELADKAEFETITKRINGGLTGYPQRLALLQRVVNSMVEVA